MMSIVAAQTKMANGTKRAEKASAQDAAAAAAEVLTEIRGLQDALEVRRDGQANNGPNEDRHCGNKDA